LSEVARNSRVLFPANAHFHIPPNLYHILDHRGFSPSIHQVFVLSRLSNYRLLDWLAIFGLVLDDIPRLQATLPARYTTLIDENVYDDQTWVLSFERIARRLPPGSLRPLAEWLRLGPPHRLADKDRRTASSFLYAKIGCHDALAFPDLLPGSIVRIAKHDAPASRELVTGRDGPLYLVEHSTGLTCSRLHAVARNRVVLCPTQLAFAHVELELGKEARIVGIADFEFRPMAVPVSARVPRNLADFWIPAPLEMIARGLRLDDLLRRARRRSGLTFREASAKSALIARALKNEEFFCAAGSLSDYETTAQAPRHIHKMFSLCILYSLSAWEFMNAAGLRQSESGKDAMPDELLERIAPVGFQSHAARAPVASVQEEAALPEFPYFFGGAAAELLKLPHLSIRDIFWIESPRESFHPYLSDAAAIIIDRRKKRVRTIPSSPLWAQPTFVLLGRDGKYVCTSCSADGKMLVMRPFSNGFQRPLRLRTPEQVEVVGRVVGVLRRLSNARPVIR